MAYRASRKYSDADEAFSLTHLVIAVLVLVAVASGMALMFAGMID